MGGQHALDQFFTAKRLCSRKMSLLILLKLIIILPILTLIKESIFTYVPPLTKNIMIRMFVYFDTRSILLVSNAHWMI